MGIFVSKVDTRENDEPKKESRGIVTEEENGSDQEEYFAVEKILAKKKVKGKKLMYRVKWAGYPDSENSWVAVQDLNCPILVEEFEIELKKKKARNRDRRVKKTMKKSPRPRRARNLQTEKSLSAAAGQEEGSLTAADGGANPCEEDTAGFFRLLTSVIFSYGLFDSIMYTVTVSSEICYD